MPLADRPLLQWGLDRLARARCLDSVAVATTTATEDQELVDYCHRYSVPCFRGSETDVLGRFAAAAGAFNGDLIVRVCADNPLIDPRYVEDAVAEALATGAEYASYRCTDGRPAILTPLGFFTEVVSRPCLERADREIADRFEREHVTMGIYKRPEKYRLGWLKTPSFGDDPRLRFTVDTQEDMKLLEEVVSALGERAELASADEVVRLAESRPQWLAAMARSNRSNPKSAASGKSFNQ